ncbi:type II/IV secretion system protein [bacterium]|nr:type II/IV secretion system protein [bacterium]NBX98442.1 type II/IV secretion system protein [bacterium]NDC94116.1 type II/IV secretion system protein [bacterium]NDD83343.1 type II/IV secretion system protein [bacterium]NDG28921.1 type II/IV secretion system protein [bacterium]
MSQNARFDEEQSTARRARILGMSYIDVTQIEPKTLYNELLTLEDLTAYRVIPITAAAHAITFGVTTSTSQQTMQMLKNRFLDQQISYSIISDTGYREYMKLYNPPKKVEYASIEITGTNDEELVQNVSATLDQVNAEDMLAYLVQQAHKLGASDIHLETQVDNTRIRFRIDGVLHIIATLSPDKYRMLVSAVASAGNVSTASQEAQQGHIMQQVTMQDGSSVAVNLRLETAPTVNGMDVVMRLFNMDQAMYNLDRLGLSPAERQVIDAIIAKPSGLVLVVGPTGSGKTTTLYSMLNTLNNSERKIVTIEDPVEYRFAGMSQLSVTSQNSGQTNFAERLRATLRLDPDVIMVGEIRDNDTAKTALQAALTGHLVLSTFHASSAAAAMTRLVDVIGQNPLFTSAIRLVMAQRLVRRLDPQTKQPYNPDANEIATIKNVIDTLPNTLQKPSLDNLTLYKPVPAQNNPYGFKGQIALREQFMMTDNLRSLLTSDTMLSSQHIEQTAVNDGMTTMLHNGILLVLAGETTLDEVFRVVG